MCQQLPRKWYHGLGRAGNKRLWNQNRTFPCEECAWACKSTTHCHDALAQGRLVQNHVRKASTNTHTHRHTDSVKTPLSPPRGFFSCGRARVGWPRRKFWRRLVRSGSEGLGVQQAYSVGWVGPARLPVWKQPLAHELTGLRTSGKTGQLEIAGLQSRGFPRPTCQRASEVQPSVPGSSIA